MEDEKFAEMIFNRWLKTDRLTQKNIFRYALRHCGLSVLTDIWCYFMGIS